MMKNQVLPILIIIFLFTLNLFSGCVSPDNPNDTDSIFYVDTQFTQETKGWNSTHFNTISNALKSISDNQSIVVSAGIYNENLIIDNKHITLTGAGPDTTIINGREEADVIEVRREGQTISGFTITTSNLGKEDEFHAGIDLRSKGNTISNIIFENNTYGLYARYGDHNQITKNLFINNAKYGAYFDSSSDTNLFSHNIFSNNPYALRIKGSDCSVVTNNLFVNNTNGLYLCCGTKYSIVFDNVFCRNAGWDGHDTASNNWDSLIPSAWRHLNVSERNYYRGLTPHGNYWDRFQNESIGAYDNNSNGVFDSVYDIPDVSVDDYYPLSVRPVIENPFLERVDVSFYCD